jgi:hypothetical protein
MEAYMFRRIALFAAAGFIFALTASAATVPHVAWETTLPGGGVIGHFVPDQNGGVAVMTTDNARTARLFWVNRSGTIVFTYTSTNLIILGVSAKGLAFFDAIAERSFSVDPRGAITPLAGSEGFNPPQFAYVPNLAQWYDAQGFFMQRGTEELTIRRYEW